MTAPDCNWILKLVMGWLVGSIMRIGRVISYRTGGLIYGKG
jgi:hypothetical protein